MKHLSQETLVMLLDGELSAPHAEEARLHLDLCTACRQRRDILAAVMELPQQHSNPPSEASRRQLAHLLAEAAAPQTTHWLTPRLTPRLVLRAAMVALLLASGFAFRALYQPMQDSMAAYEETGPRPNHDFTPGAVRAATVSDLCAMPDDDLDPAVAPEKQQVIFANYGLTSRQAKAYQVDYLINPQLGGNDDLANLWPEPYHATVWNASAKDALEARLHGMVCNGTMTLTDAQHLLSTDWIAAYKTVFHADRPVRVQASADHR